MVIACASPRPEHALPPPAATPAQVRGERYENVSQDMRPPTMEEDRRRAQLESYCGTLLDDYEDEVGRGPGEAGCVCEVVLV